MNNILKYILFNLNHLVVRFKNHHRDIRDTQKIEKLITLFKLYEESPSPEIEKDIEEILNPVIREEFSRLLEISDDGTMYLKNTRIPIPESMTDTLKMYVEKGLDTGPLENFWTLCMQNPSEVARDGFYEYIKKFGVVITKHGYAVLYKAVNYSDRHASDNEEVKRDKKIIKELIHFATSQYLRKKEQKKAPSNYDVYIVENKENPEEFYYALSTGSGNAPNITDEEQAVKVDNLEVIYAKILKGIISLDNIEGEEDVPDIQTGSMYAPTHRGSHGMKINLGTPVTMPREQCDPDINESCSYGLHVGSHQYVSSFGRGMDVILAVLVNPRDVVALPSYDNSKIRVCEYFPYAEIERDKNGNWKELEHGNLDEDFLNYEKEELERFIKNTDNDQKIAVEKRLVQLSSLVK